MPEKQKIKWKIAQKLEIKWWQRYLKNKDIDAYLKWKFNYWQDIIDSIKKIVVFPISKTILDAGCGPAGIFMILDGNKVDAIDPLLNKYEHLAHITKENSTWTNFQNQSIEKLSSTEKYDIIFCINAINHVENIELCYDNLVRALKPDGFIIISTDAHRYTFLKKIFQLIPGDMLHPYQFNLKEYNIFLEKRDVKIITDILIKEEIIFNYYITIAKKTKNGI